MGSTHPHPVILALTDIDWRKEEEGKVGEEGKRGRGEEVGGEDNAAELTLRLSWDHHVIAPAARGREAISGLQNC